MDAVSSSGALISRTRSRPPLVRYAASTSTPMRFAVSTDVAALSGGYLVCMPLSVKFTKTMCVAMSVVLR